jgi:hypothetical protein
MDVYANGMSDLRQKHFIFKLNKYLLPSELVKYHAYRNLVRTVICMVDKGKLAHA